MRTVVFWTIVGVYVLSVLMTIARVGRRREPLTPGEAVVTTIVAGGLVAAWFWLATP